MGHLHEKKRHRGGDQQMNLGDWKITLTVIDRFQITHEKKG